MASKIEGKAKVIACSWNDIKGQITPGTYYHGYSKEQLFYCFKERPLKRSRRERSNRRLSLLGSIGGIPELFDQKFEQRTVESSFFTALDQAE